MNTVSPLRDKKEIEKVKNYLKGKNTRNFLFFVIGINCNLRVSDLLTLKVSDVWNGKKCLENVKLHEKKTKKYKQFPINVSIQKAIKEYIPKYNPAQDDFLFKSRKGINKAITRQQATLMLQEAGEYCELKETLSCHSLRKTWGYWAWKGGVSLVLIMDALNHSSISITKRYLGILQEDLDNIYINLNL